MSVRRIFAALAAYAMLALPASAEIFLAASDGKQVRAGESADSRTADTLSVIELNRGVPRVLATIPAPASLVGPPASVALTRDGALALVSAAQRLEAPDGALVANDAVSVIDLSAPQAPRVLQTLQAGPGASGVAINRAGTLALVASTGDDAVTVFSIADGAVTRAGRLQLPAQSRPTDIAFLPDGRSALVVAQTAGKVLRLAVNGTNVTLTDVEFQTGVQPYGVTISRNGAFAFVTNLGGRADAPAPPAGASRIGTIAVLDLRSNTVVNTIDVGPTPEHLALSPNGRYLQVTVVNGSASSPNSPAYNDHGLLRVFRVTGSTLQLAAEAPTGQWCQGAAWSDDSRSVLLQCAMRREIEVYRLVGGSLRRDQEATLTFDARPAAIATARQR